MTDQKTPGKHKMGRVGVRRTRGPGCGHPEAVQEGDTTRCTFCKAVSPRREAQTGDLYEFIPEEDPK